MTEKRFRIVAEDFSLVDVPLYVVSNEEDIIFDVYGSKNNAKKLCDLLNEQFDKIESLENHYIVQQNHIKRLENENIQLYNKLKIFAKIGVVCDKYNIQLEDLPETLEEYIALDNGEEL